MKLRIVGGPVGGPNQIEVNLERQKDEVRRDDGSKFKPGEKPMATFFPTKEELVELVRWYREQQLENKAWWWEFQQTDSYTCRQNVWFNNRIIFIGRFIDWNLIIDTIEETDRNFIKRVNPKYRQDFLASSAYADIATFTRESAALRSWRGKTGLEEMEENSLVSK
ncbi:MAG TPA: hypothetical protein VOA88_10290 [Candidatus Dormibacteraeota bacterium]|nr:hypothetical protein [Candidatus Dormibacteraeota bacterium]